MNHLFVVNPKAGKTDRSAELRMRLTVDVKRNETYGTTAIIGHAIK